MISAVQDRRRNKKEKKKKDGAALDVQDVQQTEDVKDMQENQDLEDHSDIAINDNVPVTPPTMTTTTEMPVSSAPSLVVEETIEEDSGIEKLEEPIQEHHVDKLRNIRPFTEGQLLSLHSVDVLDMNDVLVDNFLQVSLRLKKYHLNNEYT